MQIQTPYHMIIAGLQPARRFEMEKDRNDKNIGKKLDGRYEITELIGEGGMADVYRATDVVDNKTVAVKILKKEFAENEEFLRRFRNESKAIAVLSHPNIVKIFDVGFSERIQFIVMEYIDGITLNEYMEQQGQLGWKDAVHFILQILRALQHAHSKGIVHRDIKPQNIMMLRDGTIKVMDFGIAKFAREDGKTGTDKAIGTVHYISPEQARGAATDAKSDIYSVGVMLYEMLTGKKPFDTDNPVSIAVMHMQAKVPLPHTVRPDIQVGLEEIILKAMEKDPVNRYQSARDMMDDLQTFKEDPDGVFGYYPELFGGDAEEPAEDPFAEGEDDSKTRYYRPVTEESDVPAEDPYYDDADQQPYYDDEEYYDEDYDDEEYDDDDDEEEEEERKSLFVPILSAVIIVVIVVAAVLLTTVIWNMLNNGAGKRIEEQAMPSLIGMDLDEAEFQYGDRLVIKSSQEYNADTPNGKIFDQDIKEGDPVKKGDVVNVRVSMGARKVLLQDVKGWQYELAKQEILGQHLYVDKRSAFDDDVPEGAVISTVPEGPVELAPNTYVRVTVSLGKNKRAQPAPNFVGLEWEHAKSMADGLGIILSKNEVDSDEKKGMVLKQDVKPNDEVQEDEIITLDVSSGQRRSQQVRVTFQIPANTSGLFHIEMYEGGVLVEQGASFNPDYAAGMTAINVEGKESTDYRAYLVNDATGAKAEIGTYHVDFSTNTVQMMSGDVAAAFKQVLVGGTPTTTPAATQQPVTQPEPTTTAAPAPAETQATQPQDPAATPTE